MTGTKTFIIINQHRGNYGDEAAGTAAVRQIQEAFPGSKIALIYKRRDGDDRVIPDLGDDVEHFTAILPTKKDFILLYLTMAAGLRVSPASLSSGARKMFDMMAAANHVVVAPSGSNIGFFRDWEYLTRVLIAIAAGKTPVFHLNTIGRSRSFWFNHIAWWALRRSRVFVREHASLELLRGLGIPATFGVDTAFSLPPAPSKPAAPTNGRIEKVAVIVSDLGLWYKRFADFDKEKFRDEFCDTLAACAALNGAKLTLMPNITGKRETGFLHWFEERLREKGAGKFEVSIDDEYPSFREYEACIADSQIVLSMRYHGVVLAANNTVPFVSLTYENKMTEVVSYVGLKDLEIKLWEWDANKFAVALHRAIGDAAEIRTELARRRPVLDRLARLPCDHMWIASNYEE